MEVQFQTQEAMAEFEQAQKSLQEKIKKSNLMKAQFQGRSQTVRRSELTLKEVTDLPADVPVYKSIGKMFLYSTRDDVVDELKGTIEKSNKELEILKNSVEYLMKQREEMTKHVKELLDANVVKK